MSRLGFLPGAPMTRDQWLMLQRDNVAGDRRRRASRRSGSSRRRLPRSATNGSAAFAAAASSRPANSVDAGHLTAASPAMPILLLAIILGIVEGVTEFCRSPRPAI